MTAHLQHVVTYIDGNRKPIVHLLAIDGRETLCRHLPIAVEYGGATIQRLFVSDLPVNCRACIRGIDMIIRRNTAGLSFQALEEIADLMFKLREQEGLMGRDPDTPVPVAVPE